MERLTLAQSLPERFRRGVIALGNFDGLHLGHQAVVGRAVARAHHQQRPALAATFDPHPTRVLRPDAPPFQLTSLDQRQRLFGAAGLDAMLVIPFDPAMARMSAEQFVAEVLVERAGAAALVSGHDFTFGRGRTGSPALLEKFSADHQFEVETVGPLVLEGAPVSSSRVRAALAAGDVGMATRLLSRPYAIEAVVEHGDKRGRHLGYPTANLRLGEYQRPAYGIYAVRVRLDDGSEYAGVANLGIRPSFQPPVELLEATLFDFSGDLYGRRIEVALHAYIRAEARFVDMDSLVAQMNADSARARELLSLPA